MKLSWKNIFWKQNKKYYKFALSNFKTSFIKCLHINSHTSNSLILPFLLPPFAVHPNLDIATIWRLSRYWHFHYLSNSAILAFTTFWHVFFFIIVIHVDCGIHMHHYEWSAEESFSCEFWDIHFMVSIQKKCFLNIDSRKLNKNIF